MIPELGQFALCLACAMAFAQCIAPLVGAWRGLRLPMRAAPYLAIGQLIALATSFFCLILCAVNNDFSVLNIAENSAIAKPTLYKVTGVWGNHEGSVLLWTLILALCAAAVSLWSRPLPETMKARVVGVLGGVSAGFLSFTALTSNPFVRLWPPAPDGRGMNPLLQDPGLAFHPPILYAGYVGFAVPFAFAVAALLEGRIDALWGRWVRPWALASWCLLTCGIALGSWWAYYELGWGGYWAWDPVENASLMPWLTGTALLHSASVVEKRDSLKIWTLLLAIGTFSLSLSGTFLVRSGILNSVHAFAIDPTRGTFILALLALVIGGSFTLFAWRAPLLSPGGLFAPVSREGALVLNNVLLVAACAVVLTGTIYPPLTDLIANRKISVGPPFFKLAILPIIIPIVATISIGPALAWKRANLKTAFRQLWWAALIAAALTGWAVSRLPVWPALGFGAAAWLILGSAADLWGRVQAAEGSIGARLQRLKKLRLSIWGSAIAHAGLGVSLAGMGGMAMSQQKLVALHLRDTATVGSYQWTMLSTHDEDGPNFKATVATLDVSRNNHFVALLTPSRRKFKSGQVIEDTSISTDIAHDFYAVIGETGKDQTILRLFVNPLAPLIWLGGLVMAIGGLLSLLDRRLRIGAPSNRSQNISRPNA